MNPAGVLLEARGVARRFGRRTALAPLDLELRGRESVALVGPNGAGKSTLLSLLAGALEPTAGRMEWAPGLRVGWVPQRPGHYGRLPPRENLELFARLSGADRAAADRLLAAFELPRDGTLASELSTGNRQRLNVALALLGDPHVLLLDEPSAALDPGQRRRVWRIAAGVPAAGGALVFATQNLEELELADRVLALVDGVLAFDGTAEEYGRSDAAEALA